MCQNRDKKNDIYRSGITEDVVRQRSKETKLGTNGKKVNTLESGKYISGKGMSM